MTGFDFVISPEAEGKLARAHRHLADRVVEGDGDAADLEAAYHLRTAVYTSRRNRDAAIQAEWVRANKPHLKNQDVARRVPSRNPLLALVRIFTSIEFLCGGSAVALAWWLA